MGRALVLDDPTPRPDRDSGSLSTVNLMRLLQDVGYAVDFLPAVDPEPVAEYGANLERLNISWRGAPQFSTPERAIEELGDVFDLVVLSRYHVAQRHMEAVRTHLPAAKVVFRPVDLHFLRESRRAVAEASPTLADAAERLKSIELSLVAAADTTIVVSRYEEEILHHSCPGARVVTIPLTRDIPGRGRGPKGRQGIVFIGYFWHLPNLDAIRWFIFDILPLVRRQLGTFTLHVVGEHSPASRDLLGPIAQADGGESLVLHGRVPDLANLLDECRLSVAPLRWGAGMKGKVASSLCHGLPCVATSIAVEGSDLVSGRDIIEANEPGAFAEAIVKIYRDDSFWLRQSDAGLAAARRQFSFSANRPRLKKLLREMRVPPRRLDKMSGRSMEPSTDK